MMRVKHFLQISPYVVQRIRELRGFVSRYRRYGSFVRPANVVKRLIWCKQKRAAGYAFLQDCFTDECSVLLDPHSSRVWVFKGDRYAHVQPKFKNIPKVRRVASEIQQPFEK